jgi:hypothetical protein
VLRHVTEARGARGPLSLAARWPPARGSALLIGLGVTEFSMVAAASRGQAGDSRCARRRGPAGRSEALRATTVADVERAVEAVRFSHNARRSDS